MVNLAATTYVNSAVFVVVTIGMFLQRVVDYLKFDIEGYEWGVLQDLILSRALRERIKQIGFEIHTRHIVACGSTPGFQVIVFMR